MPDAHGTDELKQALLVEDVPDHAVGFTLEEASLGAARNDSARILSFGARIKLVTLSYGGGSGSPAVLEELEAFREFGRDVEGLRSE